MEAAHDVQLGRAPLAGLPRPLDHLVAVHHIGLGLVQIGPEGTEVASVNAHIRRIDVRVDIVVAEIAVVPLAHQVGHRAEGEEVVGVLEGESVLETQPLPGFHLLPDRLQSNRLGRHALPFRLSIEPVERLVRFNLDRVSEILVETEGLINQRWTHSHFDLCSRVSEHQVRHADDQ